MRPTRLPAKAAALGAVASLALAAGVLIGGAPARAAGLQEVTGFGYNPSGLRFFLYVPARVQPQAPLLVVNHYCHGDAAGMVNGSQFDELAEAYGYIAIYPQVTGRQDQCFDLASPGAIKHDGDSDPAGIRSMVAWTQQRHRIDASRIFATGVSSGGMMTQELMGTYPDVFAAGSSFAGVPFGCFTIGTNIWSGWNSDCAQGRITMTGKQWGDIVRAAHPGYTGPRPRLQLWHGAVDETVSYVNFGESVKQWTDVAGVPAAPSSVDHPTAVDTRSVYRDSRGTVVLETHSLAGVGHGLPVDAAAAVHFFGLDSGPTPTTTATPTPTTSTPTTTTATPTTASPITTSPATSKPTTQRTTTKKKTTKKTTKRTTSRKPSPTCKNPRKCTRTAG